MLPDTPNLLAYGREGWNDVPVVKIGIRPSSRVDGYLLEPANEIHSKNEIAQGFRQLVEDVNKQVWILCTGTKLESGNSTLPSLTGEIIAEKLFGDYYLKFIEKTIDGDKLRTFLLFRSPYAYENSPGYPEVLRELDAG